MSAFFQRPLMIRDPARPIGFGMPHYHQAFEVVVAHLPSLAPPTSRAAIDQ
jgi:hypothetical protein